MKQITMKHFQAEANNRFGEYKKWQFVCPQCKTVQTPEDLVNAGVQKEFVQMKAGFSCIGRFDKSKGCNW